MAQIHKKQQQTAPKLDLAAAADPQGGDVQGSGDQGGAMGRPQESQPPSTLAEVLAAIDKLQDNEEVLQEILDKISDEGQWKFTHYRLSRYGCSMIPSKQMP